MHSLGAWGTNLSIPVPSLPRKVEFHMSSVPRIEISGDISQNFLPLKATDDPLWRSTQDIIEFCELDPSRSFLETKETD